MRDTSQFVRLAEDLPKSQKPGPADSERDRTKPPAVAPPPHFPINKMSDNSSMKARMLQHMNKDHGVSLYDYLAYYGGIRLDASNSSHSVELVGIDLDSITLNYSRNGAQKTTVIPLTPPMKNLGEARVRFVKMAYESADALKVSPNQIKTFLPPSLSGIGFGIFVSVAGILSISPSGFSSLIERYSPRIAKFIKERIRLLFSLFFFAHIFEYFRFMRNNLNKYRVFGSLRLKYKIAVLLEGYPAWARLAAEAKRLDATRAKFEKENP